MYNANPGSGILLILLNILLNSIETWVKENHKFYFNPRYM